MKATICVDVACEDEVAAVERWFATWRGRLAFCSENGGCGCCVDIWEVDAPAEALAELPQSVVSSDGA